MAIYRMHCPYFAMLSIDTEGYTNGQGAGNVSEYTFLTQQAYEQALVSGMEPQQAVEWILHAAVFRTLPERLLKYYDGSADDMKSVLRDGYFSVHTDRKERDSLRKNIANWFTTVRGIDDRLISRPYAIEMCLILHLSLERADELLRTVAGMSIRYRDAEESVAAYAINSGLTLAAYRQLLDRLRAEGLLEPADSQTPQTYTPLLGSVVVGLRTEEELRAYLVQNRASFGTEHRTAHARFTEMLGVLLDEGTNATVSELVEQNLYRRFLTKTPKLADLARSIHAGWPDESQISRMRAGEVHVSRKVLILTYLASGGGISTLPRDDDEAYWAEHMDDEPGDADFESMRMQLNALLVECGFAPLDPRRPFDWMVLFGIATGDLFDLDNRFEAVLKGIFGSDSQAQAPEQL